MEKPIQLVIEETKQKIVEVANNSHLPMWVLEIIMNDFAQQTRDLAIQERKNDIEAYQKSLNEEAEDGKH